MGSFVFSLDKFFSLPSYYCRHPSIRTLQGNATVEIHPPALRIDVFERGWGLARFQREAQAASALNHPNYAPVRQSLGEPDSFRFKNKAALRQIVGEVVRGRMDRKAAAALHGWTFCSTPRSSAIKIS